MMPTLEEKKQRKHIRFLTSWVQLAIFSRKPVSYLEHRFLNIHQVAPPHAAAQPQSHAAVLFILSRGTAMHKMLLIKSDQIKLNSFGSRQNLLSCGRGSHSLNAV